MTPSPELDWPQLVERLGGLHRQRIVAQVGGVNGGAAPLAILKGIAGELDVLTAVESGRDVAVAFLPVGDDADPDSPNGRAGLGFSHEGVPGCF